MSESEWAALAVLGETTSEAFKRLVADRDAWRARAEAAEAKVAAIPWALLDRIVSYIPDPACDNTSADDRDVWMTYVEWLDANTPREAQSE